MLHVMFLTSVMTKTQVMFDRSGCSVHQYDVKMSFIVIIFFFLGGIGVFMGTSGFGDGFLNGTGVM